MDSGDKGRPVGVFLLASACGNVVVNRRLFCVCLWVFVPRRVGVLVHCVHKMCSVLDKYICISTAFAQVLRIQFTLDTVYCRAYVGVCLQLFFDFLDRVDGCGVVFAA